MKKLKIIIIVGTDGTGKTTTKKKFEIASKYEHIVLDRFQDSIVYDKVYGRRQRDKLFYELENNLSKIADVYLVYLTCSTKIQIKRVRSRGEKFSNKDRQRLVLTKQYFEDYLKKTKLNKKIIDSGQFDQNTVVNKILDFVNGNNNK